MLYIDCNVPSWNWIQNFMVFSYQIFQEFIFNIFILYERISNLVISFAFLFSLNNFRVILWFQIIDLWVHRKNWLNLFEAQVYHPTILHSHQTSLNDSWCQVALPHSMIDHLHPHNKHLPHQWSCHLMWLIASTWNF